jgi:osmotically-inducible protein OsmY
MPALLLAIQDFLRFTIGSTENAKQDRPTPPFDADQCAYLGGLQYWTHGARDSFRTDQEANVMDDITLRQDVIDELEFEPSVDAANIGVAVESGVVTLSGHVATYAQKSVVEDIVRRVKGVKGIAEEIEVRCFGSYKTADDEIAKRALDILRWTTLVPMNVVQVKVQNGWITLTGAVGWQYQKNAAADALRGMEGVLGIANDIEVKPHASASDIKKRIEDALKRNAEVRAEAIKVSVVGSEVTLDGRVNLWSERTAAERAAWSAPGVSRVVDRITVA